MIYPRPSVGLHEVTSNPNAVSGKYLFLTNISASFGDQKNVYSISHQHESARRTEDGQAHVGAGHAAENN